MRNRCALPTDAIHGVIFSDDIMLETSGYKDIYYGGKPSGFGYTGLRVPLDEIEAWESSFFQRASWEERFSDLLTNLGVVGEDLSARILDANSYKSDLNPPFLMWDIFYYDFCGEIPDYSKLGEIVAKILGIQ
ncbi:MAG TPA: hypothetical protein VKK79_08935 [Candidatus Lokiarchaeia archaeon]|nr:hypothetical protein [Candidatus Lokiarchaeia archaeon]